MKLGQPRHCDSCDVLLKTGQRIISKTAVMCKKCYDEREVKLEAVWRRIKNEVNPDADV